MQFDQRLERGLITPGAIAFQKLAVAEAGKRAVAEKPVKLLQHHPTICTGHASTNPVFVLDHPSYCIVRSNQSARNPRDPGIFAASPCSIRTEIIRDGALPIALDASKLGQSMTFVGDVGAVPPRVKYE